MTTVTDLHRADAHRHPCGPRACPQGEAPVKTSYARLRCIRWKNPAFWNNPSRLPLTYTPEGRLLHHLWGLDYRTSTDGWVSYITRTPK